MDAALPIGARRAPRAWAPVCAVVAVALAAASVLAAVAAGWGWSDVVGTDAAANLLDDDVGRARAALTEARADVRDVLGDLRRVVYGLRPVALDDGSLVGALREEARGTQHPFVTVDAPPHLPALTPAVELAAYRVVMEALTNARRHSSTDSVAILVAADAGTLTLTVDDDGNPPGSHHPGLGLRSLRERVEELGGAVSVGPTAAGWRVAARIPLQ